MTHLPHNGMADALRLTRTGKLDEATALLRRLLQNQTSGEQAGTAGPIIDLTAERLDTGPGQTSGGTPTGPASPRSKAAQHKAARPNTARPNTTWPNPAWRMPEAAGHGPRRLDVPEGARWEAGSYTNPFGSRDYRLYVPSRLSSPVAPLVVMLHGCTQDPEDFARGTGMNELAEARGFLVAYPAQASTANPSKCWNWFNPNEQERERGEPSLIAGITRQIMRHHPVDPARVYVAGLSAGGAEAAILATSYPDLYAAVGVHSGLPRGAASDMPSAFAAMRQPNPGRPLPAGSRSAPAIVFHGTGDGTVHPANGDNVVRQALAAVRDVLTVAVEHHRDESGHAYVRTRHLGADDRAMVEHWAVEGLGHAWSGGRPEGSYTDPAGPDASLAILRFFEQHANAVNQ